MYRIISYRLKNQTQNGGKKMRNTVRSVLITIFFMSGCWATSADSSNRPSLGATSAKSWKVIRVVSESFKYSYMPYLRIELNITFASRDLYAFKITWFLIFYAQIRITSKPTIKATITITNAARITIWSTRFFDLSASNSPLLSESGFLMLSIISPNKGSQITL